MSNSLLSLIAVAEACVVVLGDGLNKLSTQEIANWIWRRGDVLRQAAIHGDLSSHSPD